MTPFNDARKRERERERERGREREGDREKSNNTPKSRLPRVPFALHLILPKAINLFGQ